MRRLLLGLTLLLPGCAYVGSPFDGFGGFIGDTHTIYRGQNRPVGDSINMERDVKLRPRPHLHPRRPLQVIGPPTLVLD